MTLRVDRAGKRIEHHRSCRVGIGKYEIGDLGSLLILPIMHPQITSLQQGAPGTKPDCSPGDVVMAAAGERDVTLHAARSS